MAKKQRTCATKSSDALAKLIQVRVGPNRRVAKVARGLLRAPTMDGAPLAASHLTCPRPRPAPAPAAGARAHPRVPGGRPLCRRGCSAERAAGGAGAAGHRPGKREGQ